MEYTRNFTAYGCTAGQAQIGIKLKRVDNDETLVNLTRNVTITAAQTPQPTVTTTPEPTSTPTPEAGTITWDTDMEPEQDGDEYGYEEREFGDIDDDDFRLDGRNYDITYLKWDDSANEVQFELDKCLKPSELVSLRIGTRTYTRTSYVRYNDSQCSNRNLEQEFEFDEDSNPLEVDEEETLEYEIELTLRPARPGKVTTPTVTAGDRSLSVSWTAPSNEGSAITKYEIQSKLATATSWRSDGTTTGTVTSKNISSLTNGSSYDVQVRACNIAGCGDWSDKAMGTPAPGQAPEFDDDSDPDTYSFSVQENADIGTVVGTAAATGSGSLSYLITAGNSANKFSMNATTGQISVNGDLDHETASSYTLTVQVSDSNSRTDTATVTITVTNVDESPSFGSQIYEASVSESTSVNRRVVTVSATDPERDRLSYSLVGGNAAGRFSISSSGRITLAKKLDFEASSAYELTVKAADTGDSDEYALALVRITVSDVTSSPSSTSAPTDSPFVRSRASHPRATTRSWAASGPTTRTYWTGSATRSPAATPPTTST